MPKKSTTFSMRMPEDINDRIQAYAAEHECTKAEAMSHFVRAGIALEDDGPAPAATQDAPAPANVDLSELTDRLDKLQQAAEKAEKGFGTSVDAAAQKAAAGVAEKYQQQSQGIVPVDIRDRIQAYSKEHNCSDEESMGYFARLGLSVSGDDRAARASEVAELSKKLDAIVADGAVKNEQLKSLAQTVEQIKGYTEPESVEVEGELADPAIEEARDALEEERREAERDERTRKIISETMDSYLAKNQTQQPQPTQGQNNTVLMVLALAIVALAVVIAAILIARG